MKWSILIAGVFGLSGILGADEPEKPGGSEWAENLEVKQMFGDGRLRHAGTITRVEVLEDGKRAVICAADGSARLWDLESGEEIRRFEDKKKSYVWMALILPGEKQMLTTAADSGVTLWDLETGELLREYSHGCDVYRVTLAPDGKTFFAVDEKDRGIFWNLETGENIREIKPAKGGFYTGLYLGDGDVLVTAGDDDLLTYWEVETGKKLSEIKDATYKTIFTLSMSPDRTTISVCCEGNLVALREAKKDGAEIWRTKLPKAAKVGTWSADGGMIGVTCDDNHLYVLDAKDGSILKKCDVGSGGDYAVAFTMDGKEIMGGAGGVLVRFDVETGKRIFPEEGAHMGGGVTTMATHGDGRVFAGVAGKITEWTLAGDAREVTRQLNSGVGDVPDHLLLSPNGKTLLAADRSENKVSLIDLETGTNKSFGIGSSISQLLFVDDDRFAVGTGNGQVEVWSTSKGARIRSLGDGVRRTINGISVSADRRRLATFSSDGNIQIWDVSTGGRIDGVGGAGKNFSGGCFFGEKGGSLFATRSGHLDFWAAPKEVEARIDEILVRKLYKELDSADFITREKATAKLIEMGNLGLRMIDEELVDSDPALGERKLRLERVRAKIAGKAKLGEPSGTLATGDDISNLVTSETLGLWFALQGKSASAVLLIGDVHEGEPRVLRELKDGHSPAVFAVDAEKGEIVTGNRDGTMTVWGLGE